MRIFFLKAMRMGLVVSVLLGAGVSKGFADTNSKTTDDDKIQKLEAQLLNLTNIIAKQSQEIQEIKTAIQSGGGERVKPATALTPASPMTKQDFLATSKEAYPWLYGLKQGGDVRLRYEAFDESDCDPARAGPCNRSRNRFRFRLRYGFEKTLSDEFVAGFRLVTGTTTDPTSTQQTMTGYFTYKPILIDQAYAIYTPNAFKNLGPVEFLEIGGGKFKNPFEKYSSKMVWDRDVTPEGLYEKTTLGFWNSGGNKLNWDLTGGQLVLAEGLAQRADAELFAVQTGLDISTDMFGTKRPVESRTGFSYYHYVNFDRTVTTSAGVNLLNGNSPDVEHMRVFDFYQEFKFYPFDVPLTIFGEYAFNPGYQNKSSVLDPRDANGFALGSMLGKAQNRGSWEGYLNYFYIGANSVAGVFSDSDFGVGHANQKGWNFGLGYALTDFLVLNWNNFVFEPVEPSSTLANSQDQLTYRTQVDLTWKF